MAENNKTHDHDAVKRILHGTLPAESVAALLYTTFPARAAAVAVAKHLVEARIAGCVNIIPAMTSIYVWEGAIEIAEEVVMIVKVPPDRVQAAAAALMREHPYESPALLVLPVAAGSSDYLEWLRDGTRAPD